MRTAKPLSETTVRRLAGKLAHIERGNARGEWVVNATACWTAEDVRRAAGKDAAAVALGRKGGAAASEAQKAAARANGRLGGRPPAKRRRGRRSTAR